MSTTDPLLARVDDLDEAIGNSAALSPAAAAKARTYVDALRRELRDAIGPPASPVSGGYWPVTSRMEHTDP